MTDLAQVGVAFDTSGLQAGTAATDEFSASQVRATAATTELTAAQAGLEVQQRTTSQVIQELAVRSGTTFADMQKTVTAMAAGAGVSLEQMAQKMEAAFDRSNIAAVTANTEATNAYAAANARATESVVALTSAQAEAAAASKLAANTNTAATVASGVGSSAAPAAVGAAALEGEVVAAKKASDEIALANQAVTDSFNRMIQGMATRTGVSFDEMAAKVASQGANMEAALRGTQGGVTAVEEAEGKLATTTEKTGGFFSSLMSTLTGYGQAQTTVAGKVAENTAAHANLEQHANPSVWSTITNALFGYGAAHEETAKHVAGTAHEHSSLNEIAKETAHVIHALHPELASAGVGMGELGGLARVARAGFLLFAAAIGGTFVVEVVKTRNEMDKLKEEFNSVFGEAGPEMLEKTEAAAKALGTTMDKLAPSVTLASDAFRKGAIEEEIDAKAQLNLSGVSFVNGDAGKEALKSMLSSSSELVVDATSETGKAITSLQQLFQHTGMDAATALGQVAKFWNTIPSSAEEARDAAVKATADFTKLFEVSGKGGDDAAAATQKFFDEIKKGGLTSDIFDKLAQESRVTAQTIAEGFGFKGPEALERFSVALEKVKGVSFDEVLAGILGVQDKIDGLQPKDSISKAWGELKTAFRETFEEIVKGIEDTEGASSKAQGGATAGFLHTIATDLKAITPYIVTELNADLQKLKDTYQEIKDIAAWFKSLSPGQTAGIAAGTVAGAVAGGIVAGPGGAVVGAAGGAALANDIGSGHAQDRINAAGGIGGAEGLSMGAYPVPVLPAGNVSASTPTVPVTLEGANQSVFGPVPNITAGTGTIGGAPAEQSAQPQDQTAGTATSSVEQFNATLTKTDTAAQTAATNTDTFITSLTSFGNDTDLAAQGSQKLTQAIQGADQQLASSAQSIPASINSAQSALQSFFDWLTSAAQSVAAAQSTASSGGGGGGGGGPQLDTSPSADVGSNAVGGIYTIGSSGGVASGSTRASGTDTINLTGTVSPGEIVAVIPADKANQATMNSLQNIISNADPISIGGGQVSGTGATPNASAELGAKLDGSGAGYPHSLSDPAIATLLAQIKALVAAGANTTSLSNKLASPASAGGGGGIAQQGDPFAEIDKQNADAAKRAQADQKAADAAGNRGAPTASRASSPRGGGAGGAELIRLPKVPSSSEGGDTATGQSYIPFGGGDPYTDAGGMGPYDGSQSLEGYDANYGSYQGDPYASYAGGNNYDPYSAYAGGGVGSSGASYDLPYNDPNYSPFSANAPDTGYTGPSYNATDYTATAAPADTTAPSDVPAPDTNTVDIGSNAGGGIYSIGGAGAASTNSYTAGTDTLNLRGTVSPGEVVAIVPADKATQTTMSALSALLNNNSEAISIGGGQVSGVSASSNYADFNKSPNVEDRTNQGPLADWLGQHLDNITSAVVPNAYADYIYGNMPPGMSLPDPTPLAQQLGANDIATTSTATAPYPDFTATDYGLTSGPLDSTSQAASSQFYSPYSADTSFGATNSTSLPVNSPFYDPYSAAPDTSGVSSGDAGATADSGPAVDVGSNAAGGIYTIGAGATSGYSGTTDALSLVGNLSPGETIAVIPPGANSSATIDALQGTPSTNVTSLGGGGAQTLGLTDAQVQDALNKVKALIAAQNATNLSQTPAAQASSGGGGGGFNTQKSKDNQQATDNSSAPAAKRGASPASRGASGGPSKGASVTKLDKPGSGTAPTNLGGGQVDDSHGSSSVFGGGDSYQGAGPYTGDYNQSSYDANFASYDLPYNDPNYSPYSAYAGDGVGYGGSSADLPYDSQFYDPYSANAPMDSSGYSFDSSQYTGDSSGFDYLTGSGDTSGGGGGGYDYSAAASFGSDISSGGYSGGGGGGGSTDYSGGGGGATDYTAMGDYTGASASVDTSGGASVDTSGGGGGGDTGGFATGGTFTVPDAAGGGTDTVDTTMHLTGGETVAIFPKGISQGGVGGFTPAVASDSIAASDSITPSVADTPNYNITRGFPSDIQLPTTDQGTNKASDSAVWPVSDQGVGTKASTSAVSSGFSFDRSTQSPPTTTTRLLNGDQSGLTTALSGSVSSDLSKTQNDPSAPPVKPTASDKTINVNVFGVQNVNGFLQSRQAVIRAMRIGANG